MSAFFILPTGLLLTALVPPLSGLRDDGRQDEK
jgi:hypothetical protein